MLTSTLSISPRYFISLKRWTQCSAPYHPILTSNMMCFCNHIIQCRKQYLHKELFAYRALKFSSHNIRDSRYIRRILTFLALNWDASLIWNVKILSHLILGFPCHICLNFNEKVNLCFQIIIWIKHSYMLCKYVRRGTT